MESYHFNQRIYKTIPALANAMGASWYDGREFLFNGGFRNQIKNTDKTLANSCAYLEKKYRDNPKCRQPSKQASIDRIPGHVKT